MQKWKCTLCGEIFEGETPPVPCPVCGAGAEAFVPVLEAETDFRRDTLDRFVIAGGGIAGLQAARAIRKINKTASVTLICGEGVIPYNRPALSDVVGEGLRFQDIALEEYSYYAKHDITLICDAKAQSIDSQNRTVTLTDGRELLYTELLIANGAYAFNPIASAKDCTEVGVLRTLTDANRLIEACKDKSILVVGGGILGLEAAAALQNRGARVTVCELAERLLSVQADEEVSEKVREYFISRGIAVKTGVSVNSVTQTGARLTDGTELPCDFVLVSIGVRSDLTLAKTAGAACNRGVLVDAGMRTDVPHIFAAGDVAEFSGKTAGVYGAAREMGAVAGVVMAGGKAAYAGFTPSFVFEEEEMHLFCAGNVNLPDAESAVYTSADGKVYKKIVLENGVVTGVLLYGDTAAAAAAVQAVEEKWPLQRAQALLNETE